MRFRKRRCAIWVFEKPPFCARHNIMCHCTCVCVCVIRQEIIGRRRAKTKCVRRIIIPHETRSPRRAASIVRRAKLISPAAAAAVGRVCGGGDGPVWPARVYLRNGSSSRNSSSRIIFIVLCDNRAHPPRTARRRFLPNN